MASVATIAPRKQAGTVAWLEDCVAKSSEGPFTEYTTITPGLASVMLGRNPNNRHLSPKRVERYAGDMVSGRWAFNGEPIIVSTEGLLNDGQHRLQAIIEANRPQFMSVSFGVDRSTRTTVDQGAARTVSHYLAMDGVKYAALSAGIAQIVLAFEQSGGMFVKSNHTHADVVARVHTDRDIAASAEYAESTRKYAKGLLTPSQVGALHYILGGVSYASDAEDFLDQVCIGENIKRGDPAFAARKALSEIAKSERFGRFEAVMRAWVAHRQGRSIQYVKMLGVLPALV